MHDQTKATQAGQYRDDDTAREMRVTNSPPVDQGFLSPEGGEILILSSKIFLLIGLG